ncbi:hypothetical protein [Streptomyces sp. JH34]|uniref:hypothetical protein n=1 Tax=Streptomyces sp. JH34 TaxID=2793633 RepID=UPI0023F71623|nr:hypothetical protein [Streptomyces sp. JH34]MDF6020909.1 hypothetical protein [Streptomyces sp. JH34]
MAIASHGTGRREARTVAERRLYAAVARVANRALAEAKTAAADDGLPLRPKPVRIRRPGEQLAAKEIDLRERLQSQPHPNAEQR